MVRLGGNVPYGWCWGHSVGRFGEWLPRPVEDVFLWDREDLARCVRDHYGRGIGSEPKKKLMQVWLDLCLHKISSIVTRNNSLPRTNSVLVNF